MSSHVVETVRVVAEISAANPNGYIIINKTDLNEAHALFDGQDAPVAEVVQPPAPVAELPNEDDKDAELSDNDPALTASSKKPWDVK